MSNWRRIVEPILLGTASNVIVSIVFSPTATQFSLLEFIVAWCLSVPITELNRQIDHRLDAKYRWNKVPLKRFGTHFLFISLSLIVLLNTVGPAYMWISGQGFFSWGELVTINLVTLCMALALTVTRWSVNFYKRWMEAESRLTESERTASELKRSLRQTAATVEIQKGTAKVNVEIQAVRLVKIDHGIVRVYLETGEAGSFPGTMSQFAYQLPEHLFFQVTRDAILHRDAIVGVSSSTFGKIQVDSIGGRGKSTFFVSRPKAASFRKWYNSNSTSNR